MRLLATAALIAGMLLAAAAPRDARAQFTAISTGNILENAPIFTQSAVVHERGGVSIGGAFVWILFDEEEFFGESVDEVDITAWQASGTAAFGLTDRITLGAFIPYQSFSVDAEGFEGEVEASGLGDIDVFGRAQLWRSTDDRTKLAALASVTLATADDELFFAGEDTEIDRSPDFTVGGAVSHDAERASLHAAAEYTFGGDIEFDGFEGSAVDVLSLSGAAVFAAGENLRLTGEILFESFQFDEEEEECCFPLLAPAQDDDEDEEDTATTLAGGVRYSASPNLFLDGGVILPVSGLDEVTAGIFLGATWVR